MLEETDMAEANPKSPLSPPKFQLTLKFHLNHCLPQRLTTTEEPSVLLDIRRILQDSTYISQAENSRPHQKNHTSRQLSIISLPSLSQSHPWSRNPLYPGTFINSQLLGRLLRSRYWSSLHYRSYSHIIRFSCAMDLLRPTHRLNLYMWSWVPGCKPRCSRKTLAPVPPGGDHTDSH